MPFFLLATTFLKRSLFRFKVGFGFLGVFLYIFGLFLQSLVGWFIFVLFFFFLTNMFLTSFLQEKEVSFFLEEFGMAGWA